ncbi:UNVERIFIED_CONTAM: hypothetical protein FKN15_062534 [Acipenser sinensis]
MTHYFGLWFHSKTQLQRWAELEKALKKQLDKFGNEPLLFFGVMFYVPNVSRLEQEVTRYQYYLQVKKEILDGRMPFSVEQGIRLAGLAVQADFGDYNQFESQDFLREYVLFPVETEVLSPDTVVRLVRKVWCDHQLNLARLGREGVRQLTKTYFEIQKDENVLEYVCLTYNQLTNSLQDPASVSIAAALLPSLVSFETLPIITACIHCSNFYGMPPAEAELLYIKEVEQLEGFGQESFSAKDNLANDIYLAVSFVGVFVKHRNGRSTSTYRWNDIGNITHNKSAITIELTNKEETIPFHMRALCVRGPLANNGKRNHREYQLSGKQVHGQ